MMATNPYIRDPPEPVSNPTHPYSPAGKLVGFAKERWPSPSIEKRVILLWRFACEPWFPESESRAAWVLRGSHRNYLGVQALPDQKDQRRRSRIIMGDLKSAIWKV